MQDRATLIYSGGSDSYTLLHYLLAAKTYVECVSFNYRQRHVTELMYARNECTRLDIRHTVIEIPFLAHIAQTSALTSSQQPMPEGHYANDNMRQTVVPNRNMILISIAAACAINNGCNLVAYGAHQGDHAIYPDCRPEFAQHMHYALQVCDYNAVTLYAPFLGLDKRAIYAWGLAHGLDYSKAWSCYAGRQRACGRCGACVERLQSFHDIDATDPMIYEDREYWQTVTGARA